MSLTKRQDFRYFSLSKNERGVYVFLDYISATCLRSAKRINYSVSILYMTNKKSQPQASILISKYLLLAGIVNRNLNQQHRQNEENALFHLHFLSVY
jgi:hypothetical protein